MDFNLEATARQDKGKGASRRLRREAKVPAVIYGGELEAQSIEMSHDKILHALDHEAFYSHILTITIDGKPQKAILKALQRHPYKPKVLHADFLRVSKDQAIRVHVPLHFLNEEAAKGVKEEGGIISHLMNQVEIECLPAALPEFIEVDIVNLGIDESVHLSDLKLPKDTKLVELMGDKPNDQAVVSIHMPKKIEEPVAEETEAAAEEAAGEGEAAQGGEAPAAEGGEDKKDES